MSRFTAYLTATDFAQMVDSAEREAWLSRLDGRESISVYLHAHHWCEVMAAAFDSHRRPDTAHFSKAI
jgi:hypothetical protein